MVHLFQKALVERGPQNYVSARVYTSTEGKLVNQ